MADTYTVVKGDTLSEIAQRFKSQYGFSDTYTYVNELARINGIKNPNYIVVGQVIKLKGSPSTESPSTTSRATIKVFGLQSNTDRTMYATWTWTKSYTEHYQVIWNYDTGDGVWFIGNNSTTTDKQSLYTAPENAKRVKFKVKPISKKRKVNNKETAYWTASWSTEKIYDFSNNPPTSPSSAPSVTINGYTLTAELTNLDVNATNIQFQIVKNDISVFATGSSVIKTGSASYSCNVDAGNEYKVRCRAYRGKLYSEWTVYSANIATMPSTPSGITECRAVSETSVYLEWPAVKTAATYEIEYATEKRYFEGSNQTTTISNVETTKYEIGGLESGQEYFFRVRGVNDNNVKSGWSGITSIIIGKKPAPPTTWSSTTTAIVGEALNLYWVHNSEDGSSQTYAELELTIDDFTETRTIENSVEEDEKDKTSVYSIDTSEYVEGTKILWRVRTAGITKVYGDWSIQRSIDIYAPPTLEMKVLDINNSLIDTLTSFPFYISALAGPNTQQPIGYHVNITSDEIYETVDNIGNQKFVSSGESVYSKYFDTNDALLLEMTPSSLSLENNINYTVTCTVSMNSGLTAEASYPFSVSWTEVTYEPNAEIGIDETTYSASIRPYCDNGYGVLVDGITLSVYRREFDGAFTELATNLDNVKNTYITDPHPALDYARYRIVAMANDTGVISYYDVPGYPVGCKSIIIQWDETWSSFNSMNEDSLEEPIWSGSILKLPYNIDVSDNFKPDSSLVKYIGRSHPVGYYGTQLGSTSTWNTVIDKKDEETLYGLRRLAIWTGNVYVREPSGSGYWANITVSFNQKHKVVTIPVTLSITRVSGGA